MKKTFLALIGASFIAGLYSFIPSHQPSNFTVTSTDSKVEFVGSKKAGYHTGTLAVKGGTVTVDNGKITGGKFTFDLASVKTDAEKLDGHLKSPDFFDVAKYPEASFEITSINYTSASTADVTGNLSLKGITATVKFAAVVRGIDDKKLFVQANFDLDRTAFGIKYGIGAVSNDVQVHAFIFAAK
jgi:polyisoprenoid-binding protein YceI